MYLSSVRSEVGIVGINVREGAEHSFKFLSWSAEHSSPLSASQ